jgi:hypothetical protein
MRMENRQDRLNSPGPMVQPGHTHESNLFFSAPYRSQTDIQWSNSIGSYIEHYLSLAFL